MKKFPTLDICMIKRNTCLGCRIALYIFVAAKALRNKKAVNLFWTGTSNEKYN